MLKHLEELIHGKHVLVLGFGKEGKSSWRVLEQVGGYTRLDIADRNAPDYDPGTKHRIISGESYLDSLDDYDIVFKSPGVVLSGEPTDYPHVTSQTDVFLSKYADRTIGVTGTKGKSTVTTLISHVLATNAVENLLAGNIGTPVFDICEQLDEHGGRTPTVLELSSHQLQFCRHSPHIAVMLNLFEEHLDHYGSLENYAQAKANIFRFQTPQDKLFCGADVAPKDDECRSRVEVVEANMADFVNPSLLESIGLYGEHSRLNCAFAFSVCKLFGIDEKAFLASLASYKPLPHRLELIGNKNGIDYYDDSISTTVESTVGAIRSIPNAKILLLGGMDRGIDYASLLDFLPQSGLAHVVLMYASGKRIHEELRLRGLQNDSHKNESQLKNPREKLQIEDSRKALQPEGSQEKPRSESLHENQDPQFHYASDLQKASALAQTLAQDGDAILLSPAAASYGDFKNFEERGTLFKQLIFGKYALFGKPPEKP